VNRTAAGFEFQLVDPDRDEANMLATFNKVQTGADDLEMIVADEEDFMIVGEEMFQIGLVEKVATNHYRARNFIRGVFDSRIRPYTAGKELYFVPGAMHEGLDFRDLKWFRTWEFAGYPVGSAGRVEPIGSRVAIEHTGKIYDRTTDANELFLKWSLRALPPVIHSVVDGGSTLTFTLRPRWYDRGAGQRNGIFEDEMTRIQENLGGLRFQYQQFDASLAVLDKRRNFGTPTFTPGQFDDPDAGVAVMPAITKVSGVKRILLWGIQNEIISFDTTEYQV
jgi:hypothetical protein